MKTDAATTSIAVSWSPASDNTAVAGYSLFVAGTSIGTTSQTSYTFSGLTCGTSYTVGVEAYDAAGNRSQRAALSTATAACNAAPAPSAPAAGGVYVATNGADANPCTQVLPCLTFERAYKAAQGGGTVEIAAGSYPPQTITEDPSKGTGRVTFRPAGGATVSVDQIDFGQEQFSLRGPDFVTIENLTVTYTRVWGTADGIVLRNLTGKTFDIFGGVGNRVYGGSYGPCEATLFPSCTNRVIGQDTVIDGVSIHGVTSSKPGPPEDLHTDGIFVRGCSNCTIRNSKFWDNDTTHIRVQNCCGQPPNEGLTIENNWFDRPTGLGGQRRWNAIDLGFGPEPARPQQLVPPAGRDRFWG